MANDDDFYDDDFYDEDLDDDEMEDCGQTPDGLCQLAGTEYCDWTCPYADELRAARIRTMKK